MRDECSLTPILSGKRKLSHSPLVMSSSLFHVPSCFPTVYHIVCHLPGSEMSCRSSLFQRLESLSLSLVLVKSPPFPAVRLSPVFQDGEKKVLNLAVVVESLPVRTSFIRLQGKAKTKLSALFSETTQTTFGVVGGKASLPCNITPPTPDDAVSLILWYKEESTTPIYR